MTGRKLSQWFEQQLLAKLATVAKPGCPDCGGAGVIDFGRGDAEHLVVCKCVAALGLETEP